MSEKKILGCTLKQWLELKCTRTGCYNYSEKGYFFCTMHLRGITRRLPKDVIEALRKEKVGGRKVPVCRLPSTVLPHSASPDGEIKKVVKC